MILKKIREIPNIKSIVTADEVYFKTTKNIILNKSLEIVYQNASEEFNFYTWGNNIFIGEIKENKVYKLQMNNLELISSRGYFVYLLNENKFILTRNINGRRYLTYYNGDSIVWEEENSALNYSLSLNEEFYAYKHSYKSSKIAVRNIIDFSLRLEYEYDPTFKVGRALFLNKNILVVPLMKSIPHYAARIVAIDLYKALELWSFEVETHEFVIDSSLNKLFGLIGSLSLGQLTLNIVDILKGEVEKSIIRESRVTDVVPWNTVVRDGLLFYSDNIEGCKIGVLETDSRSLIGEVELDLKNQLKIFNPKIMDDRLFVLDTSNICHEFKIILNQ